MNICKEKCKRNTEKLWLTGEPKMAYNKGTKKAVHSSEWLPKSYVSTKIVTFALEGGWLFFCTYNHNDKYPKRNHQRKCLICTHVIPPPFGDGSHPAVVLPASIIQGSEQAVNRKEILVYSVNL